MRLSLRYLVALTGVVIYFYVISCQSTLTLASVLKYTFPDTLSNASASVMLRRYQGFTSAGVGSAIYYSQGLPSINPLGCGLGVETFPTYFEGSKSKFAVFNAL